MYEAHFIEAHTHSVLLPFTIQSARKRKKGEIK